MFVTWQTNIYLFLEKEGSPLKNYISQKKNFSKKSVKMTLNSLEVTKCCKNQFIPFLFFWSSIFFYFLRLFYFIFRIIYARTSYAATVGAPHLRESACARVPSTLPGQLSLPKL